MDTKKIIKSINLTSLTHQQSTHIKMIKHQTREQKGYQIYGEWSAIVQWSTWCGIGRDGVCGTGQGNGLVGFRRWWWWSCGYDGVYPVSFPLKLSFSTSFQLIWERLHGKGKSSCGMMVYMKNVYGVLMACGCWGFSTVEEGWIDFKKMRGILFCLCMLLCRLLKKEMVVWRR